MPGFGGAICDLLPGFELQLRRLVVVVTPKRAWVRCRRTYALPVAASTTIDFCLYVWTIGPHSPLQRGQLRRDQMSNPRRAELAALSKALKPLVKAGKFTNTNAAVMAYYQDKTGFTDFRTFNAWRKAGFIVRKGESGFPIWAQPRRMEVGAVSDGMAALAAVTGAQVQGPEWFPVCYLFHAGQVDAAQAAERIAA